MSGYSWVSVVSIFCYLFLLLTFASSGIKTKKVLHTFIAMLAIMILWNGGSLGMRLQLWPSPYFWHHVSLLGMLMVTVGYFHFVLDFLDDKNSHGRRFWLIFYAAIFVVNCVTNFFIPLPEVIITNGQAEFLYHYSWHIYVLLAFIIVILLQLAGITWRHCRGNRIATQQLLPVVSGLSIMLIGHTLATLPMFVGFPADMLSGAINAFFLFYALYKKKLFRMSILLSKYNYAVVAVMFGVLLSANTAKPAQRVLMQHASMNATVAALVVAAGVIILVAGMYLILTSIVTAIFTKAQHQQQDLISQFSENITHMLSVEDILRVMSDTLTEAVEVDRLFVLIRALDGNYYIEHTIKPLEGKTFSFCADHPLVTYFKTHNSGIHLQEFARTTVYRSMWEKEKALLSNLHIEYAVPMVCEGELIGITILSGKQGKTVDHIGNNSFYQSLSDICAVSVKNAYTYEKAIKEAQKDDLTGLINNKFFFEILDREFERCKDTALSLCILSLDDFRLYNQLYGTHEGDFALQRVAGILLSCIGDTCYAARINGDEFALILPGYDIYSAKCLADNIALQIRGVKASVANGESSQLTASIGICAAPYMASTAKELYRNTDMTVYSVKRTGKNAVQMYSAEILPRESTATQHKSGYSENASTIYALAAAIDAKDHYTFQHSQNVAYYASSLAKAIGMEPNLVEIVKEAGLLHDIGKIGIREEILNKPGKLTSDQYEAVKKHVENAVNIIQYLPSMDYVIPAVRSHHERYDGKGYPNRLADDNIPITGRILSIADAFDAMTSIRNYKDAMTPQEAIRILRMESGKQFDPMLAQTFIDLVESGEIELCCNKQHTPFPGAFVPA
ncbi:MAG: diguanylate cyclase [Oscillospiraceae bacterium]|nr:diguanylate cyclase [Oscillospiraceae bacterium]